MIQKNALSLSGTKSLLSDDTHHEYNLEIDSPGIEYLNFTSINSKGNYNE